MYDNEMGRILKTLGHPEAFVTDESALSDFPGNTPLKIKRAFGLVANKSSFLVDIAQRIRLKESN